MIKGIIFDLDGVLVDAVEWHYQALNRALTLFGYPIERPEHASLYNGLPTSVKLELLTQRRGFPRSLHPFVNEMKQRYTREILEASVGPQPRVTAMLTALKESGYRIAVASNCIRATVDLFLERMEIGPLFDVVLSHEDVARPKPSPEIYLRSLELLGVRADECLILEDSVPGIQAARQVTPNVIVVTGPEEVTLELVLAQAERRGRRPATVSPAQGTAAAGAVPLEIVIPMAGQGQRFAAKGYDRPKPLIEIFGKPMVQWVVENIRPSRQPYHFTFLCNERHLVEFGLERLLHGIAPGCDIVPVPSLTEGAACTLLLALDSIDPARPLLVANSDQWVESNIDHFLYSAEATRADGLILTFPASDTKWSYARTDDGGRVVEIAEKRAISPHATVGIYYFRRGADFADGAREMIRRNHRVNGEFYVCPVYNELIARGKVVRILEMPSASMHGLGTPEDLDAFVRWNLAAASHRAVLPPETAAYRAP